MRYLAKSCNRDVVNRIETDNKQTLMEWIEKQCDLTFYKTVYSPLINKTEISLDVKGIGLDLTIISKDFYSYRELKALLDERMESAIEMRRLVQTQHQ